MIAPLAFTDGTLNEYALGGPMCGFPSRLKRMRSIALASVAVPTVERGLDAHPLLVDDDRGRQAIQHVHLRPRQRRHEALHEGAVGLVDQPLRLRGDRAEHQRALARAGDAGEHRQPALRDLDADVLEVVHPRALHADQVVAVGEGQRRRLLSVAQLTAFFTSAAIFFSSAAVSFVSANEIGHMAPSSSFAASLNPNVAYRALNFSALWKKQMTLPSFA